MGQNIQDKKAEEAIGKGNVQELIAALSEGADADRILKSGNRLIHEATEKNDALLVGALLHLKANPNAQDAQGDTALHRAAEKNYTGSAIVLLDNTADPSLLSARGDTPLHRAAEKGSRDVLVVMPPLCGKGSSAMSMRPKAAR